MLRRLGVLVLAGLALSCGGESPTGEVKGRVGEIEWHDEGPNLLSLLHGAVIRDRSGEISLEFASILAIDGHPTSSWSSPPGNIEQWVVAELPVRSRIEAVGLSIGSFAAGPANPKGVRFETSLDGIEWYPVGTFDFEVDRGKQLRDVTPADAKFIRVTTLTNHGDPNTTHVPTLLAQGEELETWQRPSVSGHWVLNNLSAQLLENGNRIFGRVEVNPPMLIDGAWDGRIIRFAWARGRSYGVGLLAVNPDGNALNGLWWHENLVDPGTSLGSPWFGTRLGPAEEIEVATSAIAQIHIERDGRFPLFGIVFDSEGRFDAEASRPAVEFVRLALNSFPQFQVRLEVAEYHSPDPEQDKAISFLEASSLRDGLVAVGLPSDRIMIVPIGSERPYAWKIGPLNWEMYSRVDFSLTASE